MENIPNVQAVTDTISPNNLQVKQQLVGYAKTCVKPGLDTSLIAQFKAFKAVRFFSPYKLTVLKPDAMDLESLRSFPFLDSEPLMSLLKAKLPAYLAKAGVDPSIHPVKWWKENVENSVPNWSSAARKVLVMQPSSAAAERVFSLLSTFSSQQDSSLKDYIESSLMIRYNK